MYFTVKEDTSEGLSRHSNRHQHEIYIDAMRVDFQSENPTLSEDDVDEMFEIFVSDMTEYFKQWKQHHFK